MRSILEKALIALLNEDKDQADALFHNFILERSRQIHESLRQGEDLILDENWEQSLAIDEMFTEDDLADEEEVADEVEAEGDDVAIGDDEVASDDVADDVADEEEAVDAPIEDRVEDLESQLQSLAAEFDALMGGDEADVDADVDALATDVDGTDFAADGGDEFAPAADVDAEEDEVKEDEDFNADSDEDFAALGESIVDELETVNVKHAEGMTTAAGDKASINDKSIGLSKKGEDRQAGEPVEIKSTEHNGYALETAPKSDKIQARRNTLKKATDGQSKVSKEGDKSAVLNTLGDDKSAQHSLFDKKTK